MPPPARNRLLLAGALTGLVLIGGAGAADAGTSADAPADPGPSGYAVVVDESPTDAAPTIPTIPTVLNDLSDCPYAIRAAPTEGADL